MPPGLWPKGGSICCRQRELTSDVFSRDTSLEKLNQYKHAGKAPGERLHCETVDLVTSHTPMFANSVLGKIVRPAANLVWATQPSAQPISHNRLNTCQGHTIHRLHTHPLDRATRQPTSHHASQPASQPATPASHPSQPASMTTNEHDHHSAALWAAMPSLPPLVQSSAAVCSALDSSPSLVGGGDCRFGDMSRQSCGESACHTKLSVLHTTSSLRPHQLAAPLSCLSWITSRSPQALTSPPLSPPHTHAGKRSKQCEQPKP
jgi:hypothetical protein